MCPVIFLVCCEEFFEECILNVLIELSISSVEVGKKIDAILLLINPWLFQLFQLWHLCIIAMRYVHKRLNITILRKESTKNTKLCRWSILQKKAQITFPDNDMISPNFHVFQLLKYVSTTEHLVIPKSSKARY